MGQIGDQCIDRIDAGAPRAARRAKRRALCNAAFLAHHCADTRELVGHMLIKIYNIVQGIGDLPGYTSMLHWHTHGEIAFFYRHKNF